MTTTYWKIKDGLETLDQLKERIEQAPTLKGLDRIISTERTIRRRMDELWSKRRAIKATKTELCGALYDTISHTAISAIEQFYEIKFARVCDVLFADHREISESVQFCVTRLSEIRELLALIFSFEHCQEPPLPCTERFAAGFKAGFQDGVKQLKSFVRKKLIEIQELKPGNIINEQESIDELHKSIPLLGDWLG